MRVFSEKKLIVGDKHRTNNMSLQEGGSTVEVHYKNGFIKVYTNVKYPNAYIKRILEKTNHSTLSSIKTIDTVKGSKQKTKIMSFE